MHPQDVKWNFETQVVIPETSPESPASAKPGWMPLAFQDGFACSLIAASVSSVGQLNSGT